MKPVIALLGRVVIALLLGLPVIVTAKEAMKAGAAEIDITPHVGYRMAGYFNERLATGTHDPLKAKVIILQDGKEKFAFGFCDLVGLSLHVTTNARAQFSAASGIPVSHIVIAATHSHTGPSFDDVRRDYFHAKSIAETGKDPQEQYDYADFLTDRLVKVFSAANAKIAPAQVSVGIAHQEGLSFNRRYHMKNGKVAFNPGLLNPNIVKPAGPMDPDVPMLSVKLAGETAPTAGFTVFACHADTIGGTEFSADYPFFLQETLRRALGADYISAFGAGTCGDINHINTGVKVDHVKGFDVAEHIGTTLGQTVLAAQKDLVVIKKPRFAVKSKTFDAPLQDVTPEQVAAAQAKLKLLDGTDESGAFMEKVDAVKAVDWAIAANRCRWRCRCSGWTRTPPLCACRARFSSIWDWRSKRRRRSNAPWSSPSAMTGPVMCRPRRHSSKVAMK
ncbi:MAG: hypothetical protein QM760_12670 [Nibricoccus sp.]